MGTLITVELHDEFFESLFKEGDMQVHCIKGLPKEAKLLEIKPHGDNYTVVFQLPERIVLAPQFECRPI